ncbi:MAG: leucine-rich repeat domain-containing protein, partial [Lachnospiraceae bacterium]|nr:leucine-rich repeat domain-containing protein [Lachnospiraceae bacterium]
HGGWPSETIEHDRDNIFVSLHCTTDFQPHPIVLVNTTIERTGWQYDKEILAIINHIVQLHVKLARPHCSNLPLEKLPTELTEIGESAFENCEKITYVNIPSGVSEVGKKAFSGCKGVTDLSIKSGVVVFSDEAFSGCNQIKEITFPKSVLSIGSDAFSGCSELAEVTIPKGTKSIKSGAFSGSKIDEVVISKTCSVQQDSFPSSTKILYYD